MSEHTNCHESTHNHGIIASEVIHHIPYAIFSVALGLVVLSFLNYFSISGGYAGNTAKGAHILFHSFHFLHIIFAVTGSLITFSRFSNNLVRGILVSLISSLFFCTMSDVIFPYLAGRILGVNMHLHICLVSELHNIIPLLFIGLLNGFVMSKHNAGIKSTYSVGSHFGHILVSSLASLFYLVSEGFSNWYPQMGMLFVFLIVAIVVPCTFADVIVPVYFAKRTKNNEKHTA